MLFKEIITVDFENHIEIHKYALWTKCSKPDDTYIYARVLKG
jgi:hypothetical protein